MDTIRLQDTSKRRKFKTPTVSEVPATVGGDAFIAHRCQELLKSHHAAAIALMVRSDSPLPAQLDLISLLLRMRMQRYLLIMNGAAMHTLRLVPGCLSVRVRAAPDRLA